MAQYFRPVGPAAVHIYNHPLIDWGAVIGGTLVAIATGFALTLLGVAIGVTSLNPFAPASEQAPGWTVAGGLWVAFANLVAIQLGAFVAARAARWPDHHNGMLQGAVVWALSFAIALGILGAGVAGILVSASDTTVSGAVQGAVDAAQVATGDPSGAANDISPAEADAAKQAAALTAWWAFGTMILGLVGGLAGGRLGSDHPDWHVRDRAEARPVTMADKI